MNARGHAAVGAAVSVPAAKVMIATAGPALAGVAGLPGLLAGCAVVGVGALSGVATDWDYPHSWAGRRVFWFATSDGWGRMLLPWVGPRVMHRHELHSIAAALAWGTLVGLLAHWIVQDAGWAAALALTAALGYGSHLAVDYPTTHSGMWLLWPVVRREIRLPRLEALTPVREPAAPGEREGRRTRWERAYVWGGWALVALAVTPAPAVALWLLTVALPLAVQVARQSWT